MMIGDPRLELLVIVGLAEAARVRELQADEQIVESCRTARDGPACSSSSSAARPARFVRRGQRLIGIGPAVGLHGRRLAAPDELRAAAAEVPPAPQRVARWASRRGWRPSLPSDGCTSGCRRGSRRSSIGAASGEPCGGRQNRLVHRQVAAQLAQPQAEGLDVLELGDFRIAVGGHGWRGRGQGSGDRDERLSVFHGGCGVSRVVGRWIAQVGVRASANGDLNRR